MDETMNVLAVIYDTLFRNTEYEQFNINNSNDQYIDMREGEIRFDYYGNNYCLSIRRCNEND